MGGHSNREADKGQADGQNRTGHSAQTHAHTRNSRMQTQMQMDEDARTHTDGYANHYANADTRTPHALT
eukprot:11698912-Alexandrium_andersonii.AAC.1